MTTESFVHEKTLKDIDKKIIDIALLVLNSFWSVAKSAPKLIVDTIFGNPGNDQGQNNPGGLLGNIAKGFGSAFSGNTESEPKSSVGNTGKAKAPKIGGKDLTSLMGQMPSSSGSSKKLPGKNKSNTSTKGLREIQDRRRQEMYSQRSQSKGSLHSANTMKPGQFM